MLSISFEVDGRRVDPNSIVNALEASVLKQVESSIRNSVGSLQCRKHGQAPRIMVKGHGIKNLSFEVSGCCNALINDVKKNFK